MNKQDKNRLKLNLIFYDTFSDLMILKAIDPRIVASRTRLTNKVMNVVNNLIDKSIDTTLTEPIYQALSTAEKAAAKLQLQQIFTEHFKSIFHIGEQEINHGVNVSLTQSAIPKEKLDRLIDNRAFKASDTTMNRVTGDVMDKLKTSIEQGKSLEHTTEEIITETRDMAKWEVDRISRTETQRAYNQSKLETMKVNPKITGKRWVNSGLSNSREAHVEADGQTVAVDEPFIVDGEELMYPGDPDGSPENTINCACTMVPDTRYHPENDETTVKEGDNE